MRLGGALRFHSVFLLYITRIADYRLLFIIAIYLIRICTICPAEAIDGFQDTALFCFIYITGRSMRYAIADYLPFIVVIDRAIGLTITLVA
jgi:hypothetical protein